MCEMKNEMMQIARRLGRLQDKLKLASDKFVDAAKDGDQKTMDEARLEIHTLYDSQLDMTARIFKLNEEYNDTFL